MSSRWTLLGYGFKGREHLGPASDDILLFRFRLIQTPLFGLYIHRIYRDDLDRDPHNHPWTFWSFVIAGSYVEDYYADTSALGMTKPTSRQRNRWSLRRFPITAAHRITGTKGTVTTLVLAGRRREDWRLFPVQDDPGGKRL